MKKIIYSITVASLLLVSCKKDFLDTQSKSKQTSDNVFNEPFFTEAAIQGIYAVLTETYYYGQKISTNWCTNSDIEFAGLSLTDYVAATKDAGSSNYYGDISNQTVKWDVLYKEVELATNAVVGLRNSTAMKTSDSTLMKAYLGEALTLRAMGYFELVKHFGDVPFKIGKTSTDLSNVFVEKTDRDTVYKYILNDLLEAQNYLPWLGGSVSTVSYTTADRITKGFVKGFAARVALFAGGWSVRDRNLFPNTTCESNSDIPEINGYFTGRSTNWKHYYEIANQQTAEIIGSSENPHALDDFENIWKTVCNLDYNTANENLFEVAFGVGNSGDIGTLIGMKLEANSKYGAVGMGGGNVKTNAYYFYSFDTADTRRDVTLTNIYYTADNKEKFGTSPIDWNFAKWRFYWMSDAYLALYKAAASGRISTGINWIVMRYSDVLLMFAESQNELYGETDVNATANMNAQAALEKVRNRAFKYTKTNVTNYHDQSFFEAITNERAWEFGGEGLRKYDLIRWGLLGKRIEQEKDALCKMLNGKNTVFIYDKAYLETNFPDIVYYKFTSTNEFIDRKSINYNKRLTEAPSDGTYSKANWLSTDAHSGTNLKTYVAKILTASTGLNAYYDYSGLIAQLDSSASITTLLNTCPKLGNGVCNNRHPFPIYTTFLVDSRGKLKNSYGY